MKQKGPYRKGQNFYSLIQSSHIRYGKVIFVNPLLFQVYENDPHGHY